MQKLVLLGASTGGPGHIQKIIEKLPETYSAPVIIAQHMNGTFVKSVVDSYARTCRLPVKEGYDGMSIDTPCVVLAKGPFINELSREHIGFKLHMHLCNEAGYSPSITKLFLSAAELNLREKMLGVIMTGIGDDGAEGLLAMKNNGSITIAESEKTAIVYGMPRVAAEIGAAQKVLDFPDIVDAVLNFGEKHDY